MKSVPLELRANFNALYVLQQYFPKHEAIAQRKDAVRRRIGEHLARQGAGRTLSVERIANLPRAEFRRRFLRTGIPVVLAGAAAEWRCSKEWSFESFKRRFGTERIKIVEREGTTETNLNGRSEVAEDVLFGDLLDGISAGNGRYLRFSPLLEKFPELLNDIDQDFLQTMASGSLGVSYLLFIGSQGTGTPLHNEMTPLLIVNVSGVKRWTLVPNTYLAILDPTAHGLGYNHSEADLAKMDVDRFPGLASIDRMEAVMQPGDVLFVPAWAWHSVRNDSPHIGVRCGLIHPTSMVGTSVTLAWIRMFAARDPSISEVLYKVAFKKYVPEERWLPNPRIYWRFAGKSLWK
jgi:hypothetical protein